MRWSIPRSILYFSTATTAVGGCYLIKDARGGPKYQGKERLDDKVVIVTGANTGLGKATAEALANRGAKVVLACRDMEKCETARFDIVLNTKNKYVYCRPCDLASQESIRKFVENFTTEFQELDILINNGGVMRCPKTLTKEGIELQLGVNHMGHFLLTNLLLDVLKKSAPSRIINLASSAHKGAKLKIDDLNSEKTYDAAEAYGQSKLANVLFTKELASRLTGTGVTVNAVHPGIVNTEIVRHMFVYNYLISKIFVIPLTWLLARSPQQGVQTVLYAALDPSLANVTGEYFSDCAKSDVSEAAQDDKLAKWLWLVSEKWTKLAC